VGQALLIDCSPQVMLLAIYLYEDFIDVEGVAIASMLFLQSSGVDSSELDAPEPDGFVTDGNAAFSEQVFDE
jgi:hypothetical protein